MRREVLLSWIVGSLIGAAILGAIVLALGLLGGSDAPTAGVVRASGPLPAVAGATLDGGRFSRADYRGKALVVNFWNPYCAPCRQEATTLDLAAGHLSGMPVVLAGVLFSNPNFPHDVPAAQRFARDAGEQYPTIDDPSHDIAGSFDVRGIPVTVIADARGRLRYTVLGALKPGQLEGLVRRVLRS